MQTVKNKKININNANCFGFKKNKNSYIYKTKILKGDFILTVEIEEPNIIKTNLREFETNEIYSLHLSDAVGDFVGQIREEYNTIIQNIINKCFDNNIFKFEYTYKVINYIKQKYGDDVEYLWEKFPDNAVARRKDNKKWYLAILTVKKDKLGLNTNENVEVIDLRVNSDELPELLKKNNIYPGYHMNKKHWISIILDGSMKIDEIYKFIDKSYHLAKKK